MLLALGAASAALDALTSLISPPSSQATTGFSQKTATPFNLTSASGSTNSIPMSGLAGASQGGLSPATMSALLEAQGQSSATVSTPVSQSDALKNLFSQIDANGDGQISKSEFENALGAGGTNVAQADDVFSKMDRDGDGSVSLDEMSSVLKGAGRRIHHHHHATAPSSTTSGVSASAASAYSAIEQARQQDAKALSASLASALSVRV